MGLRDIIKDPLGRAVPQIFPGRSLPTHEPNPDRSIWIPEMLAKTWLGWKKLPDTALATLINSGRVKSLVLNDGRRFADRKDLEAIMAEGTIKLEASTDPAGAYINRDVPKPKSLIQVDPVIGSTEQRSKKIAMQSPFRGGGSAEVPE
jgi:hypothetical protein